MAFYFEKRKGEKNKIDDENIGQKFFRMSYVFNKIKPEDFGLISTEQENIFIDLKDSSKWEKRHLIDLGWGLEVAFCKLPYLSFEELLKLSFYADPTKKTTDFLCAIGVLLNDYSHELLDFTEKFLADKKNSLQNHKEFYHLVRTQMNYDDKFLKRKWQDLFEQAEEII